MSDLIGKSLGRYHILEQLGEGGMATVYKAYDTRLERDVAIKIIRRGAFPPEQLERILKRFEREAKALAKLSHPNIIKVIDYGEYEGSPYFVMEYMPGGTLKKYIGKSMPWQEAVRLLIPIANALDYAHENKVVHRDVKPANILLTGKNQPMLSDFGIAKILEMEGGHTLTGTGVGVGTPEYMAPEQGMGKEVDGRADIYSLGIVFFELVTGRKPYIADTPMAVVVKHINDPLPRPRQFIPDLPEAVERVLLKALAKDPKNRYPDVGAFVAALEGLASGNLTLTTGSLQSERVTDDSSETLDALAANRARPLQKPRASVMWIGMGAIGIVLVSVLIGGLAKGSVAQVSPTSTPSLTPTHPATRTPFPTYTPTITNTPPPPTATPILEIGSTMIGKDGMVLMYVPAGEFAMGSGDNPNAMPRHQVTLDAYWIDQTEVINQMFSAFVSVTGYQTDAEKQDRGDWRHPMGADSDTSGKENHPVVGVSWNDAVAYCTWAERRLPTEAEWEKAARGGLEGRKYPWGDESPTCQKGAKNGAQTASCGVVIIEVKTFAPNGYGLFDMAGNVWEWVMDWYDSNYYASSPFLNPQGPASGQYRMLRGGASNAGYNYVRSADRYYRDNPAKANEYVGFRCALSAP